MTNTEREAHHYCLEQMRPHNDLLLPHLRTPPFAQVRYSWIRQDMRVFLEFVLKIGISRKESWI